MCKKLIIGIVTIVLTVIIGNGGNLEKQKTESNSIAEKQEVVIENKEIAREEMTAKAKEIVTEVKEDVIVEKKTEEKQEIEATTEEVVKLEEPKKKVIENPKEKQKSEVEITKKEEKVIKPAENKVQEEKNEVPGKTTENKEEQKTQQENIHIEEKQEEISAKEEQIPEEKTEEKPVQVTKEKITYNKDATQQLIDDIDEFAKQNPSLWDKNGNKLYKIEKAESLVGQNYMCPYRKQQVAGVVINVFPVKFLVYAIDVEKDGYTKETRYYIDVASLN